MSDILVPVGASAMPLGRRLFLGLASAAAVLGIALADALVPWGWFGIGWAWACESDSAPNPCGPPGLVGALPFVIGPAVAVLALVAYGGTLAGARRKAVVAFIGGCLVAPNIWFIAQYGVNGF